MKPLVTKTKSNKRQLMLVIEGYNFQFKNFNKDQTIKFWRCAKRSCRVLLHTTLQDDFLRYSGKVTRHSHLPNPAELEVRNVREAMRQRAEEEIVPLQQIAEQEVRQALLTAEALAVLPNITNIGMLKICTVITIN
jgi:MarR-like DNA-binding transcriptional regulator SgrR of sgrS sRNA